MPYQDQYYYLLRIDQRFPKECFMTLIKQPFEITEIPIPIGYHEILTKYYGDYTEKKRYEGYVPNELT